MRSCQDLILIRQDFKLREGATDYLNHVINPLFDFSFKMLIVNRNRGFERNVISHYIVIKTISLDICEPRILPTPLLCAGQRRIILSSLVQHLSLHTHVHKFRNLTLS